MQALALHDLNVSFRTSTGVHPAVQGIGFSINRGETLGLVGESGSGKSAIALAIMKLLPPESSEVSGQVLVEDKDLYACSPKEVRRIRGKRLSMIFQEPMAALNPCHRIGRQISEVFAAHGDGWGRFAQNRALELLRLVRIEDPEGVLRRYPHELSGGMRQRVIIAIALAYTPAVIVADEPTTALDVITQAEILSLIKSLQRDLGLAVLLISHDIGVIAQSSDHIAVMYSGRMVETGEAKVVIREPRHPYTAALLGSIPRGGGRRFGGRLREIPGSIPPIWTRFEGCRFEPRCSKHIERCRLEVPPLLRSENGTLNACWRAHD